MSRLCARLALLVLALLPLSLSACQPTVDTSDAAREVLFVIAPGTAARQAAGEAVTMLPPVIVLTLGTRDILVIRNDDREPLTVDGLRIDPGQRAKQRFSAEGVYQLVCSGAAHSEQVQIRVEGPKKR